MTWTRLLGFALLFIPLFIFAARELGGWRKAMAGFGTVFLMIMWVIGVAFLLQ